MLSKFNLFQGIPDDLPAEQFDVLLQTGALRLERIISRGHATPVGEWYDQDRPEWVLVVRGSARLQVEGMAEPLCLEPGDSVMLPAHLRHRVVWTDPVCDTVWLALHHQS